MMPGSKAENRARRARIYAEYDIPAGSDTIRSPGKFEGEPAYAPYFYEDAMCGGPDDYLSDGTWVFEVQDSDLEVWPELEGYSRVLLREDEVGFVYCELDPRRAARPRKEG